MRLAPLLFLAIAACSGPEAGSPPAATARVAEDDGSYLERIDPLGGQWRVERIGEDDLSRFEAWVNFSSGGFLNHGAGCSGGHPAFYRLDGNGLTLIRREPVRNGLCAAAEPAERAAAVESEFQLARFLDQAVAWSRPDGRTLILTAEDGTRAVLTRPEEPYPDLAGRWRIESIGGAPLVTERRPPTLSIAMNNIGAYADCNSMGTPFTIPEPGRISSSGPMMSTAIGCAPEDAAEDDLMAQAIISATAYRLEGDRLVFTGGPGMVVRRPPAPDRRLPGEYQACGNTMLGAYHEGPITLDIDERAIRDNAGCAARYTAEGPILTLQVEDGLTCSGPAPPVVPGEPIGLGGDISLLALAPPDGFAFDEEGRLILRTPRGLLTMCRKGSAPPFGS